MSVDLHIGPIFTGISWGGDGRASVTYSKYLKDLQKESSLPINYVDLMDRLEYPREELLQDFQRFYAGYERILLSGFVPWLQHRFTAAGVTHGATARAPLVLNRDALKSLSLRPAQLGALQAVQAHGGRGILKMGTGAGKTRVAAGLVVGFQGERWLYVVHRSGLAAQTLQSLLELGVPALSLEMLGEMPNAWVPGNVLITTYQSLINCPNILRAATALAVDECHRAGGDEFLQTAMRTTGANIRVGLSATPLQRDDKRNVAIVGAFGPIIYERNVDELVADGTLTDGTVTFWPHDVDPQQTRKWGLEYKRAIVHDVYRNDLVRAHVAIATKPCLVLVQEKEHGERLRKLFEADDVRFVTGDDPATYRTEVLRDFNVGKFPILIGTPIFEEGVDIPNLATLVNAAGFKSEILSIQRLGRCVRRAPGKTSFTVVDFEDRGHPWFTEHSQARADTYAELGFHVYGMKTKVTPEDLEERRELEAVLLPKRGVPAGWNHRGLATAKPDPEADRKAEILQGAQTLWSTFKVMATFMLCGGVLLLILGWLYGSCVGEGL